MANGHRPGPDDTIYDDSTIRDENSGAFKPARGCDTPPRDKAAKQPVGLIAAIAIVAASAIAGGLYLLNSKDDSLVFNRDSDSKSSLAGGGAQVDKDSGASGQDVLKEVDRVRLKQVSLAIQIYTADYDDVLPRPLENLELIYPYLKDRELMHSALDGMPFKVNRKFSGYMLNAIEDIAGTPLLYSPVFNDGTRVVAYADSHVKIVKDDPMFATLHEAEPLNKLPVDPPIPDDDPPPGPEPPGGAGNASIELASSTVEGRTMKVPLGWKHSKTSNGDMRTYKWEGPGDGTYIRLDITPDRGEDLYEQMLDFESRFQRSSRYKYERRNIRTGSEAYNGGVLWNFRISKDGAPLSRRTIAYWKSNGNSYGLVTNSWDKAKSYAAVFTQVLNSIQGW